MNRLLAAAVVLAIVPPVHAAQKADKGKKPAWHADYARAKAERADKLLFVVFRCQP